MAKLCAWQNQKDTEKKVDKMDKTDHSAPLFLKIIMLNNPKPCSPSRLLTYLDILKHQKLTKFYKTDCSVPVQMS